MAKIVTPQPMPTTGWPDRVGQKPEGDVDNHAREGIHPGKMSINPGRPASGADK